MDAGEIVEDATKEEFFGSRALTGHNFFYPRF
jgi:hypothetical protein